MKKALIASTALVLSAGVAAADVTISGYGRTGVIYTEDQAGNDNQIISRLRMNVDAATSTDQGVDFGARFRIQWDQNSSSRGEQGELNAGKLWITASGMTVEIGNVDTAFDSAALLYGSELGSFDRDLVRRGSYFAYNTGAYSNENRVGVAVKYAIADVKLMASYVDPDQTGLDESLEEEFSISAAYTWNDRLELSGAAALDGAGIADNDVYFVGARYAVMPNARVGLNFIDADSAGQTFALYGDYTLADGMTNIEAYVANNDAAGNDTDNAFGIGVNYDLGGARLGASVHRGYDERVTADMGVRFDF